MRDGSRRSHVVRARRLRDHRCRDHRCRGLDAGQGALTGAGGPSVTGAGSVVVLAGATAGPAIRIVPWLILAAVSVPSGAKQKIPAPITGASDTALGSTE